MYLPFLQTTSAEEDASNQWLYDYLQCCYRVCVGYLSDALCCFLLPHTVVMAALLGVLLLDLPCLGNRYGYLYVVKL